MRLLNPPGFYPKPTRAEWIKVLRRVRRVDIGFETPCWIWLGYIDSEGYGEKKYRGFKRFVHRIACAWARGGCPAGKHVEHRCKQRACCNPAHLDVLDAAVNCSLRSDPGTAPAQVNADSFRELVDVPF